MQGWAHFACFSVPKATYWRGEINFVLMIKHPSSGPSSGEMNDTLTFLGFPSKLLGTTHPESLDVI